MNLLAGLQKFPITMKLNFLNRRNLLYLAEIAAVTRIFTGIVRVWENKPSKLKDPRLSENEKRLAMFERFFVEILGTTGYMFCLHFGQDLASKFFEKQAAFKPPVLADDLVELTRQGVDIKAVNEAIKKVYGTERQGLMHRILYGDVIKDGAKTTVQKANLSALRHELGDEIFTKVRPYINDFARRANVAASVTVLGGVILSALFGGFVTQWVNDRVASPMARAFLSRKFGDDTQLKKAVQHSQQELAKQQQVQPQVPLAVRQATTPAVVHRPLYAMPSQATMQQNAMAVPGLPVYPGGPMLGGAR